jgi:hypothetical protein
MEAQRKSTRIEADIPIPIVNEVPTYDADTTPWKQPTSFIHVTPPVHFLFSDPLSEIVEYDIDSEDEAWLARSINQNNSEKINADDFELFIDTLEKALSREHLLSLTSEVRCLWEALLLDLMRFRRER